MLCDENARIETEIPTAIAEKNKLDLPKPCYEEHNSQTPEEIEVEKKTKANYLNTIRKVLNL